MSEQHQYDYYRPERDKHVQVKDTIQKYIKRTQKRKDEKDIANEIKPILEDKGIRYSEGYLRNMLKDIREILIKNNTIKINKDERGGLEAIEYIPIKEEKQES